MADILDMEAARAKREASIGPDPEFVQRDAFGRIEMVCFTCSYEMDGAWFTTRLWAKDWPDVEKRAAAIRESLKVDGQLFSSTPG